MSGHQEIIICPSCRSEEIAEVEHTQPFYSYVHNCKKCDYIITESDWDRKYPPQHKARKPAHKTS